MASIRDTLTKLLASDKPEPGTPLARAVGQYPFQQGEAPLEAPMLSPDDLIGTGIGKAALVGAGKVAPMLAGTFIGPKSKLWNTEAHSLAKALEAKGATPEEIWKQTGNVKAPDNIWRQEIADNEAKIKAKFDPEYKYYRDVNKLGDLLEHPKLFEAYPEAKDIEISQMGNNSFVGSTSGAYFSPKQINFDTLKEYPNRIGLYEDRLLDPNVTKSSLLHETGHYIQQEEKMSKGGSPKEFVEPLFKQRDKLFEDLSKLNEQLKQSVGTPEFETLLQTRDKLIPTINKYNDSVDIHKLAFDKYKKLLGEAEARLTQNRIPLTQEERLQNFPYAEGKYGLDVPYKDLLVKELLKNK